MYLFILENFGTWELILIGIVALMVLGPRKLPEMVKKAGSLMREFRSVSNDFKSTWAKEVNLDEEKSMLNDLVNPENLIGDQTSLEKSDAQSEEKPTNGDSILPEVREVSKEDFEKLVAEKQKEKLQISEADKESWL